MSRGAGLLALSDDEVLYGYRKRKHRLSSREFVLVVFIIVIW